LPVSFLHFFARDFGFVFLFNQFGDPECAVLRRSNQASR
jgi:hypothetical protein